MNIIEFMNSMVIISFFHYNRPAEIPCHLLRTKIDTIIAKSTPYPDPDAPEDPESVRFWCRTGATHSEREKTSVTGTARASIATNGDSLAALTGDFTETSTTATANRPALRALVDVAAQPDPSTTPAPAAKGKAKAKAKAKVKVETSKTPAEQRVAVRFLFQIVHFFVKLTPYMMLFFGIPLSTLNFDEIRSEPRSKMDFNLRKSDQEGAEPDHQCWIRVAHGQPITFPID